MVILFHLIELGSLRKTIQESKNRTFARFITALSIRHVGKETAELIIGEFSTIDALENASVEDLANKSQEDMMKVRNLGKKSLDEVTNKLIALGLGFSSNED